MTSCATLQGNGSVNGRIASAPHPQPVLHALTFIAVALCVLVGPWPVAAWAQSAAKPATPAQLEAKRKCPDGPYSRCGELIGPYAEDEVIRTADKKKIWRKELPPHERTFGGVRYKIPHSFAQVLDPTGETSSMVAYWIPLAYMADGSEAAGTKLAREALKLGLVSPYGVRIFLSTSDPLLGQRSTYDRCKPKHIDADALPTQMNFDMTLYVDRGVKGKLATYTHCYVSDDSKYVFYPGVPVTYFVLFESGARGGSKATPKETRAEAGFTLHNNKVWVRYMFQTEMFPYWKEIHTAVLNLIQSWEQ